jgi:competence ComEA-like helix-hairpin-helix protein
MVEIVMNIKVTPHDADTVLGERTAPARRPRGRRVPVPPLATAERIFLLAVALVTILGTGIRRLARDDPSAFPGLVLSTSEDADAGDGEEPLVVPPRTRGEPAELDRHIERVARALAEADSDGSGAQRTPAAPVDVNTAAVRALERIPGIGPVIAARIVEERNANGPFESVDDLARVRGIGAHTVETLRPWIVLRGEETPSGSTPAGGR